MSSDRDSIRDEFRDWLAENWDPALRLRQWRERLVDSGWAVPSWPREWFGRALPVWVDSMVAEEIRRRGAVGLPVGSGISLAAPTIIEHADDSLKHTLLRATLTGDKSWCQLFSEPGAGSDLASLSASAVRDGDEWVVNGQKVWNTSAHHADYGMLLVRTDPRAAKHDGITYLVLPMHQPGVEVRPIQQMNRHASFNEVFLDDARAPLDHVIGAVNDGWRVARATLAHERSFATMRRPSFSSAERGPAIEEAEHEANEHFATYVWYPQRAGRADLVIEQARKNGRADDPIVRDRICDLVSFVRVNEWTAQRASAARALGRPPGPEGSLGKLAASEVARRAHRLHTLIAGAQGMVLNDDDDPGVAVVAEVLQSTPAQSIAGGTDEIQRSIIGEKILGLPREP